MIPKRSQHSILRLLMRRKTCCIDGSPVRPAIARAKLSDTLFGYQLIAGVDYQVSEPVSIGLKFRWADFGEFESDPREWDQLRSHDSARSPGGARVQYTAMTEDIQFWGVSLNMKYQF